MSSHVAVTTTERPASMRRTKMRFWDGMGHTFMMPSITAKGTGIHSHPGSIAVTDSCSAWARLSTAAISRVSPSGAEDSNDTLHLPTRRSSGGVGRLGAGRRRAGSDFPLLSRANSHLGHSGQLRSRTAPAAQGGATPASSLSAQRGGESPWPWGAASSYSSPPQKAGNSPQKSPPADKQGSWQGGITWGRWHCTAGLVPVAGRPPRHPQAASALTPALLFRRGRGKGKERTRPAPP